MKENYSKENTSPILVTGAAGFIGFHLCQKLIAEGFSVLGLDNINDYYDQGLKYDRLLELGVPSEKAKIYNNTSKSRKTDKFSFIRLGLEDREELPRLFEKFKFSIVVNLAAQAGVRYSIDNPEKYVDSNLVGFANLLECCRKNGVEHLLYASSSSVYGQNKKIPFSTQDNVDHPISLYAATKKSNELMAYTYSHLYDFQTTGLRFFTVYGPWGRPDMAMFLFTDAIIKGETIKVFNSGDLERDFTYIDDIITGIFNIITGKKKENNYQLYNIGNSKPVKLMRFIEAIENELEIEAKKEMLPMQPGDVTRTWADIKKLQEEFKYTPSTTIDEGVKRFIEWYKGYYCKEKSIK